LLMLVLLSFGLVLVATVLLMLGLLTDGGLTFIYISIGFSVVAAIVLVIAVRLTKGQETAPAAPAPLLDPDDELVAVGMPGAAAPATTATLAPPPPPVATTATEPAELGDWRVATREPDWESDDEWGDEPEFPIAEYDDLKVSEILPLLPQLYSDELDVVESRERQGKARSSILTEISALRLKGGAAPDTAVLPASPAPANSEQWEVDDEATWDEAGAAAAAPLDEDEDFFPIEDYDVLSASEIIGVLGELDDEELDLVRAREAATRNRRTILANIDRRTGTAAPAPAPPPPAPAKRAAPAPAEPAPSVRTTPAHARKAAPSKKAAGPPAPAERATPARKTAAPAPAPAKRPALAAAKKAPKVATKATEATKTPAKKIAAPANKAAEKKR